MVQNNFGQNQTFLSEKSIWALHSPKLSRPAQNVLNLIVEGQGISLIIFTYLPKVGD